MADRRECRSILNLRSIRASTAEDSTLDRTCETGKDSLP